MSGSLHRWGEYLLECEAEDRRERKLRELELLKRTFSAAQEEPFQYGLPYPNNRKD